MTSGRAQALVSGVTAWVCCRVFADDSALPGLLVALLVVHGAMAVLGGIGVRRAVSTSALAAIVALLLTVMHYRPTMWGPLPTMATLDQLLTDLRVVVQQFPTAVAPVPPEGPFAVAITLALLVLVLVGAGLSGRGAAAALIPTGCLVVVVAAIGTDRAAVSSTSVWLATAAAAAVVLRRSAPGPPVPGQRPTLVAGVILVALTAGSSAAVVGTRVPWVGEPPLIDARNRIGATTEVLDPLVDIRARMTNFGKVEMFTMQASGGHYWRSMGLPVFDGSTFSPGSGDLHPDVEHPATQAGAVVLAQVLRVTGLRGHIVPAAATPRAVSPEAVWWDPGAQSLVVPDFELGDGDSVAINSTLPHVAQATLTDSGHEGAPEGTLDVASLPESVSNLADEVTALAVGSYGKLLALQAWFRSEFEYDLSVQLGDSIDAMELFLRDRRGFCQQFAVAFAAMARSLGIPAQVAVGFTQGDLGADGLYHVYGRHAHAWVEVWFDAVGWVAFDPTPGRGNPDATAWTHVAAAQDDSLGTGHSTVTGPQPERPTTSTTPASGGPSTSLVEPAVGPTAVQTASNRVRPTSVSVAFAAVGGILLAAGAWLLFLPLLGGLVIRWRRPTPAQRVAALWRRSQLEMADAGAPLSPALTPQQWAGMTELTTAVDHRALRELAQLVTTAVYSPADIDSAVADRCRRLVDDLGDMARPGVSLRTRCRNRTHPRAVWARSAR